MAEAVAERLKYESLSPKAGGLTARGALATDSGRTAGGSFSTGDQGGDCAGDEFWISFEYCTRHMTHWYLHQPMPVDAPRFRLISEWKAPDPEACVARGLTDWQQQPQFVLQVGTVH